MRPPPRSEAVMARGAMPEGARERTAGRGSRSPLSSKGAQAPLPPDETSSSGRRSRRSALREVEATEVERRATLVEGRARVALQAIQGSQEQRVPRAFVRSASFLRAGDRPARSDVQRRLA